MYGGKKEYMIYLPLYDGVDHMEIGIDSTATIYAPSGSLAEGGLPILFYGTSITQGGCVSRPGMAYPSIISRKLDKPVINLGFSGNGRMDGNMADWIKTIPASATGVEFFKALAIASGAAKGAYSRGPKTWVMNEVTYTKLVAEAMAIDAGGAIVSGVNGTMPVLGGDIEVLNFIPDNVIIGGYFDLYILGERRGPLFGTSEHVRFLADQTVLKGTARYDGGPAIAEAFVAVGIGSAPTATMTFAAAGE
jgi:hypothetical protein